MVEGRVQPFSGLSRSPPVAFNAQSLQRPLFAVFAAANSQATVGSIHEEMKAIWVLAKAVARFVTPWSGAHAPLSGPRGGVGTMMPGETPPPPGGTAAAGRACANCGVLQQVGIDHRPCGVGVGFLLTDEVVDQRRAAGGKCRVPQSPLPVPSGTGIACVGL